MTYPHGETVVVHHPGAPGEEDGYGETTPGATDDEPVHGVAVAPGDTRENLNQQATVHVEFTLYRDTPFTVEHDAQITVRGVRYEVDGAAKGWINPYTGFTGTEVAVGRSQ